MKLFINSMIRMQKYVKLCREKRENKRLVLNDVWDTYIEQQKQLAIRHEALNKKSKALSKSSSIIMDEK